MPLLGGLHIGTPLFFDLGVYLVVLGVTSKSIMILTYSMEGRSSLVEKEQHLYAATNEKPIEKHRGTIIHLPILTAQPTVMISLFAIAHGSD